jgi:hypothetical protein
MRLKGILPVGLTLLLAACGTDTTPTPASYGTGGSGGAGGKAGAAGAAGKGAAGSAGASGSSGASGKGGASAGGAAGAGGSVGGAGGAGAGAGGTAGGAAGAAAGGKAGSGAAGAGAGGASGQAGQGGGGTLPVLSCSTSAQCATNEVNKLCDATTGKCVGCLPGSDTCGQGQYCNPSSKQCAAGCKADADCSGEKAHCDPGVHVCKACLVDAQCPAGSLCSKGACVVGCSDSKPCADASQTCCSGACRDLSTDIDNCQPGFLDCNLDPSDGCEVDPAEQGACLCEPGTTKPCYDGPAGTDGVGVCKGGVQACAPSGMAYIPGCLGQVLPQPEACGDGLDHDCNGAANDVPDVDGDGWTACNGDCCEDTTQCSTPAEVNPGAIEVVGDSVDNDCNGTADDPLTCASAQKFKGVTPQDAADAMELCKLSGGDNSWGVVSAEWVLADGSKPSAQALNDIKNFQAAVLTDYGTSANKSPKKSPTMLGMSSGRMRDKNDNGEFVPVISGSSYSTSVNPPSVYTSKHGNALLPGKCGGTTCPVGNGANDSVNLRLKIRVPTNAKSFSYDFRFFTGEYQTFQCTTFNDYFLALLSSANPNIPADHNISFDSLGNAVSVNNGFFQTCGGNGKNCGNCPAGTGDLAGTGMEDVNGGGTLWLTTTAPVNGGELLTLELMIFDVGDHIYDSLVLVDNFQFLATPSGPPTTSPAK